MIRRMTRVRIISFALGSPLSPCPRALLLLSLLWACPRARPLRGDQRPGLDL